MRKTQSQKLLAALQERPMTAYDCLRDLGIARAAARVFDLRQDGYDIESREVTVHNRDGEPCRVAEYRLAGRQLNLLPAHPGRGVMTHA